MISVTFKFDDGIEAFGADAVGKVVKELGKKTDYKGTIGVRITHDAEVQQLNLKYGHEDKATDVLSFRYTEGAVGVAEGQVGDMVLSVERIKDQAKRAGTDEGTELALLTLHGALHIFGHDHPDKATTAEFDELQKELMIAAGLTYRNFGWQDVK